MRQPSLGTRRVAVVTKECALPMLNTHLCYTSASAIVNTLYNFAEERLYQEKGQGRSETRLPHSFWICSSHYHSWSYPADPTSQPHCGLQTDTRTQQGHGDSQQDYLSPAHGHLASFSTHCHNLMRFMLPLPAIYTRGSLMLVFAGDICTQYALSFSHFFHIVIHVICHRCSLFLSLYTILPITTMVLFYVTFTPGA